ncbi:hypothetical protein GOBAR_AA24579 [Gossypium barbadense]|uniref:non-specific serine/threonine protein kinase n=1 Tax=Gossypium barbadense TaxID=3634 RepID=A0A2P5WYB7_GOSBA|nr:hypothetical protein GOBAR_AA24579 [Gossypium barbadense]
MPLFLSATSCLPLVFFTIILLSVQVPPLLSSSNEHYLGCSKQFHCGKIKNVSYPFWGGDRPEYCGQPGLKLTCLEDEETEITIMSVSYKVIEININLQAFTVARIDYLQSLCPRTLLNTTLNFNLLSYAWNLENITLYYHCPLISNISSGFPSLFNCSTSNGTDMVNYYVIASVLGNLSTEVKDGLRSCDSHVIVPAFYTAVETIKRNPTPDTLVLPLGNGFGLKWDANIASKCEDCNDSGGRCGYNNSLNQFTCYCPNHTDASTCLLSGSSVGTSLKIKLIIGSSAGTSLKIKLIIGFTVVGATVMVVCLMVFALRLKKGSLSSGMLKNLQRNKRKNSERIEAFIMRYGSDLAPKRYSYSDIKKITKSFKDKLGEGGFGSVYKGKLPGGRLVAVKVLSESREDGEEFINEVASISRTSHVNIVTFLGFCYESSIRALLYEFMPNGSLDKYIYHHRSPDKSCILTRKTMFEIAVGVARGLEYLHRGCNTRILHLDIKPHNILLDENFVPKISDFGLAKLCERKGSILSSITARGTIGYIAPELFCRNFGGVSYKSDVYSYGMMVLEMVGAKENIHVGGSLTSEMNFPSWIYEHLEQEAFNLEGITVEDEEITRKMIIVSLWCIQTNPSDRPSMTKVLEMLQGNLQSLAIPPRPFLFSPQRSPPNSLSAISFFASSISMNIE